MQRQANFLFIKISEKLEKRGCYRLLGAESSFSMFFLRTVSIYFKLDLTRLSRTTILLTKTFCVLDKEKH